MKHWFTLPILCGILTLSASFAEASEIRETPAVRAYKRASGSVVNIHTEKTAQDRDSVFNSGRSRKINGMGTGVIFDERGYVVTNYHVIADVELIRGTMEDGSEYEARTVAFDRDNDLAVLKIEASRSLTVAPFGISSDIYLAERVLAIGNAYGYRHTVTEGIVSALGRDVEVNETQSYHNLIQTDASINPGNSGGPLVNMDGDVIGINVAIRAGAQRIGFAIPIDDARKVVARLIASEQINQTYHGMMAHDIKSPSQRMLVVDNVLADSPAARAGLKAGDVITRSGGRDVTDGVDFERALIGHRAGEQIEIVVRRSDKTETVTLALGQANAGQISPVVAAKTAVDVDDKFWSVLGLKLAPLPANQRNLVGSRYRGGMKVLDVRPDSPASANGIMKGDILVGLHEWETITVENVSWIVTRSTELKLNPLKFYIVRGQETLFGHLQTASR